MICKYENKTSCIAGLMAFMLPVCGLASGSLHDGNRYLDHLNVSAGVGGNWLQVSDSNIVISSFETDRVNVNHVSNHATWKLGLGYYLFEEALKNRDFFNSSLIELNYYHMNGTATGQVWLYQQPLFNDYAFTSPITNNRLLLDWKPNLFKWKSLSPYAILGIGAAWNRVSYHETPLLAGIEDASLSLDNNTTTQFSYDLGAGLRITLNEHINLAFEYLYNNSGHATPVQTSDTNVQLQTQPSFDIQSQSAMFVFNWKM